MYGYETNGQILDKFRLDVACDIVIIKERVELLPFIKNKYPTILRVYIC